MSGSISLEDMISCIQEWFAQCSTIPEVAHLYHNLVSECDKQLEYMCKVTNKEGD